MGKANKYIGFNDKLIGAIMVPLSALIIPMIFLAGGLAGRLFIPGRYISQR